MRTFAKCALLGLLLAGTLHIPKVSAALACEETATRHAESIHAEVDLATVRDWRSRLMSDLTRMATPPSAEVYGQHEFVRELPNGWQFRLIRVEHGWLIRLFDKDPALGAVDLSQITPPLRGGVPNARQIFGWHFRNADNTGPNEGEVNAPQYLRLFLFEPALAGTGGLRLSDGDLNVDDAPGRGWLQIHELGLTDLLPDKRARANYLKFTGCLTWPRELPSDVQLRTDAADLEIAGRCGLDLKTWRVHALVSPSVLGLDIDGDDANDLVFQITNRRTDERSLGLCRAGTWFDMLGERVDASPGYLHTLSALENWRTVARDFAEAGDDGWPESDGDLLVVEREEKSMYLIYWKEGGIRTLRVYGR